MSDTPLPSLDSASMLALAMNPTPENIRATCRQIVPMIPILPFPDYVKQSAESFIGSLLRFANESEKGQV